MSTSKIALGTAQFGMNYGIANRRGQLPEQEVADLLSRALAVGIDTLDTAVAYGDSETILGRIGVQYWKIISKVPAAPDNVTDVKDWMFRSVKASLERLGRSRLDGLMLHNPEQLTGSRGKATAAALVEIRSRGLADKIGYSIYDTNRLELYLQQLEPEIIQVPFNILDQKLLTSGWLSRLKRMGCEVHTRSAFLQGLLLMSASERPSEFAEFSNVWEKWDGWLGSRAIGSVEACLRFVLNTPGIDRIVVGVDSIDQLDALVAADHSPLETLPEWPDRIDPRLINPSLWSSL